MADTATGQIAPPAPWAGLGKAAALASGVTILLLLALTAATRTDYVGIDNDDVMRLIEVRDLIGGQSWFDMTQYRLGLSGGTDMHWSRLVDAPIALLVTLFGAMLSPETAERLALTVWPLLLVIPALFAVGLGSARLGGRMAMLAGILLLTIDLVGSQKFRPGAIDHHNVQIVLMATLVAGLLDPSRRALSYGLSGLAAALAIAVGVETVPLIAAACLVVGLQWVWHGPAMRLAAQGFALGLALGLAAAFLATIPPQHYARVTCDNLSIGFFSIAGAGGLALFAAAWAMSTATRALRLLSALACGGIVIAVVVTVAPQCLGNPLSTLDPLLADLWLSGIGEAWSMADVARMDGGNLGTYYAPGLIALLVCLFRIGRNDRREQHLLLAALLATTLAVAMVQVRGSLFSNLIAIVPLAAAIADLRARSVAAPANAARSLAFAGLTLASLSPVWAIAALAVPSQGRDVTLAQLDGVAAYHKACGTLPNIEALIGEPAGVVLAPSELGVALLRYTPHRVLTAPYHRNQAGMLAELTIGMAGPEAAGALLAREGITHVAFCPIDPQTRKLIARAPEGLYARLARGEVPAYLQPMQQPSEAGLTLYRVKAN